MKEKLLAYAEVIDAFRAVPRIFLIAYAVMVFSLLSWYMSIDTIEIKKCDPQVLEVVLDSGAEYQKAEELACKIVGVEGGPTTQQATLVTAIVGLSSAVFGFYAGTGRNWGREREVKKTKNDLEG